MLIFAGGLSAMVLSPDFVENENYLSSNGSYCYVSYPNGYDLSDINFNALVVVPTNSMHLRLKQTIQPATWILII